MSRILRIELRRSAAAATALALLVAGAVALYSAPDFWAAGWMPVALEQRQYLVLLWPLALAAGAWQARREHRSQVAELFAGTPLPVHRRVTPMLILLALAAVTGYAAITAAAAPWIADTARYLPPAMFAVLAVGALSLVAAVWLGMAAGRLLPSPLTAPAVAVAGMGLLLLLTRGHVALLSPTRGLGLFHDFRTISGRVSAAQAVWLAALATAAVVLMAASSRWARAAALLPAALGATAALLIVPAGDIKKSPIDPAARELVCADGGPAVCVSRAHAGLLPEVTGPVRQALARLARVPGAPTVAAENVNTFLDETPQPHRPDTLYFRIGIGRDGHLSHPGDFLPRLLYAGGVSDEACPEPLDEQVSHAVAYWLLDREPPGDRTQWQQLRSLPGPEAAARVAAVRAAALQCRDLDGLLTRDAP